MRAKATAIFSLISVFTLSFCFLKKFYLFQNIFIRIKAYLLCSIIAIQKKKVNEKSKAKEKRM